MTTHMIAMEPDKPVSLCSRVITFQHFDRMGRPRRTASSRALLHT
jgi:hypothetical protein